MLLLFWWSPFMNLDTVFTHNLGINITSKTHVSMYVCVCVYTLQMTFSNL